MRLAYILPALVLLIAFPLVFSSPGITDKEVYNVGEPVRIHAPEGVAAQLIIEGGGSRYRLLGTPGQLEPFEPRNPGNYSITMQDESGQPLLRGEFTVISNDREVSGHIIILDPINPEAGQSVMIRIDPPPQGEIGIEITAPRGTFRYNGEWHDSPFTPKNPGQHEIVMTKNNNVVASATFTVREDERLIRTQKQQYGPGESITIHASEGIGTDWFLIITSGGKASKYFGTDKTVHFSPIEAGRQIIQAVSRNGTILDEIVIEAAGDTPIASAGFILEDAAGKGRQVESRLVESRFGTEIEIPQPTQNVAGIRLRGLRDNPLHRLKIQDVDPVAIDGRAAAQSYWIDPTTLQFDNATVTVTAKGRALYKCKQPDLAESSCLGEWEFVRSLEPGEEYRFLLTPQDPLFSEQNTTACGCADSATNQNSGSLSCSVFCTHTINVPSGATSFSIEQITYSTTVTINPDATTISNANHNGYYDHDQDHANADDAQIGSSTSTSTTTIIWQNGSIAKTGPRSFTDADCSNWPDYCNYNIYLNSSNDFQAPGQSRKSPNLDISLDFVNYTLNYTIPGPFNIILNKPDNNGREGSRTATFNFTATNENGNSIDNCTLYTNQSGWDAINGTTNPNNATPTLLSGTFSADGTYLWNVQCVDDAGEDIWAISNRTVHIDTTQPHVQLRSPVNSAKETSSNTIAFTYNVSDFSPIGNCSLHINGNTVKNDNTVLRNQDEEITYTLQNGLYNWSIGCYDTLGNFNITSNYSLNVTVPPQILTGLWYETDTQDCTDGFTCTISAAQQADGSNNHVSGTISSSSTERIVNATSAFIGSNGGVINAGSPVDFSSFFQAVSGGNVEVNWHLFVLHDDGSATSVCSDTAGTGASSGAASAGTCQPAGTIRMQSTDRFSYAIDISNTHPNQVREINHTIDHANSFFDATNFTQIGTLSAELDTPLDDFQILQFNSFVLACTIACETGSCLGTQIFAQTNASGSWEDISGSGTLTLNGSETNPHSPGTISNTTTQTSFAINASQAGIGDVRCRAESIYQNASTQTVRVEVLTDEAPSVALAAPGDNTWQNKLTLNFTYTPLSFGTYENCSLHINGQFNQSNTTAILNNQQNNFTATLEQQRYNWSVSCWDTAGRRGNSSTWHVDIDIEKPGNITLNQPGDGISTASPDIEFNWTATDNRAANMTCNLLINGTVNQTLTSASAIPSNVTVEGFEIGFYIWNVSCTDFAGNTNTSNTRNFTVFDEPPNVFLYTPGNNSAINTTSPLLKYNASDNFGLANCSLHINGQFNQSNQSPLQNGLNNFTIPGQASTWYNWSVTCQDTQNNSATDGDWTFYIDTTLPSIDLNAPDNNTNFTISTVQFTYNATDDWPTLSCSLHINGTLAENSTVSSGIAETDTISGIADGQHDWNVTCMDNATNSKWSETRIFNVNETPSVLLSLPANGTHQNGPSLNLTYTPSDNDGLAACELNLNGQPNQTNTTIMNDAPNNFTITGLGDGEYNWSVACNDSGVYGNRNESHNFTFVMDNTLPIIILDAPQNNETLNESIITFYWNATDNLATHLSCDLYINGALNVSGIISKPNEIANVTVAGFTSADYGWNITCADNATNTNTSNTRNFTVKIPPEVNLTAPENGTYDVLSTVTLQYIPSGGTGSFNNCSLYVNGQLNQSNSTIVAGGVNNFTLSGLSEGRYDWNVTCIDTNLLTGSGAGYTYYFDITPMSIFLYTPENESVVVRNNVSFVFEQIDNLAPSSSCDLYLDDGVSVFSILSNQNVQNGTNHTHYELLGDGQYAWNATCVDLAGNFNVSYTYDFTVDAPPNVTLYQPLHNIWNNTGNITFIYTPEDDIQIKNCTLYFNGVSNRSDTVIQRNQNNSWDVNNLQEGYTNWTVGCYDSDDNFFAPANFSLNIDYSLPFISLNTPAPAEPFTLSTVEFNYTPQDNLAYNLSCDLTINGSVNRTDSIGNGQDFLPSIAGFTDGLFLWNVTCIDQAQNQNTSETRNFTVQEPPSILLLLPPNGTRTANTTMNFTYVPDDNSGAIAGCFLTLNGQQNASNSSGVVPRQQNNITSKGLSHNTYLWDVSCADPSGNAGSNGTTLQLHVDLLGPNIQLHEPQEGGTFNTNNITFNWTATDFNASIPLTCTLGVSNASGPVSVSGISGFSGSVLNTTVDGLSDGAHTWSVTCTDDLGNANTSLTRIFNINQPDLVLNETSQIRFSNANPDLGETLTIEANVSNIGGIGASGVNVSFWNGNPSAGGVYIGSDTGTVASNGSQTFSVPWTITAGLHTIHVSADPGNNIGELNETNNNATATISVLHINITLPDNSTITADNTPRVDFNMTDHTGNTINYDIFIDGSANGQTGIATDMDNVTLNLSLLADGTRAIVVQAEDTLGRTKNSTTLTLHIDTTAPATAFITQNATWFNTQNANIEFNLTDAFSTNIDYSAYLNGIFNRSNATTNNSLVRLNLTGLPQGRHELIIESVDDLGNTANSTALTFYIDTTAPRPNITTQNGTWFDTTNPTIDFNLTDNIDTQIEYVFYVDGIANATGSAVNASAGSDTLNGLLEGSHEIILEALDEAGNRANSTPITINIDTTAPDVTLLAPANDTNFTTNTLQLNWTAQDNLAQALQCSVLLDNVQAEQFNLTSGENHSTIATGLSGGLHYWNVTCQDDAGNNGLSETWQFFIELPDFIITPGNITFSNSTPKENDTIIVNATIFNAGSIDFEGTLTVQFHNGDPDAGGQQINGNLTIQNLSIGESKTVNISYVAKIGLNQIYVVIDPPTASGGVYQEENETNNKAHKDIWVGLYEVFAGTSDSTLQITDASIIAAFQWNQSNITGSNVFVADSDSTLSFTDLHAIGRNVSGGSDIGSDDFEEIDSRIGTTNLNDSVNLTWTSGGSPHATMSITAFKRSITGIPVINSTNTSAFRTGIVWDASDVNPGWYNASQDIAFVTIMNQSRAGQYGTYDYEVRVPATLRDYIAGGNTVTFYTELR